MVFCVWAVFGMIDDLGCGGFSELVGDFLWKMCKNDGIFVRKMCKSGVVFL